MTSRPSTLEMWVLRTWNMGQIFKTKLCMVGLWHSRWLFWEADCWKMQVSTWFSDIVFHLQLSTLAVTNSESCQRLFPSFCAKSSEVAVLFYWILRKLPFLGQVIDLDILLCKGLELEHVDLFLSLIFTQRPIYKIKRLNLLRICSLSWI